MIDWEIGPTQLLQDAEGDGDVAAGKLKATKRDGQKKSPPRKRTLKAAAGNSSEGESGPVKRDKKDPKKTPVKFTTPENAGTQTWHHISCATQKMLNTVCQYVLLCNDADHKF